MSRNSMAAAPDWFSNGPPTSGILPMLMVRPGNGRVASPTRRFHPAEVWPCPGGGCCQEAKTLANRMRRRERGSQQPSHGKIRCRGRMERESRRREALSRRRVLLVHPSVPTARLRQRSRGVIYGGCGRPLRLVNKSSFAAPTRSGVKLLSAAHRQVPSIFPSHSPCATRPLHYRLLVWHGLDSRPSCAPRLSSKHPSSSGRSSACPRAAASSRYNERERERETTQLHLCVSSH